MKKGLYFAAFVIGVAIGSLATWHYVKKKYEKIAQEEIDSVKAVFANRERNCDGDMEETQTEKTKEKPALVEYAEILQKYGYTNYSNGSKEERRGNKAMEEKYPYVISPEEFGEFDEYEKISLTYYADGVLADDNDEIVEDVEDIVGDALGHFGEYEDDSVFVRCDERSCDYEILLDLRNFSDVSRNNPHWVNVL